MKKYEEYVIHVESLRKELRDSRISLLTLSQGLGLSVKVISDCLFFRGKQNDQLVKKLELFLEDTSAKLEKSQEELAVLGDRIRFVRTRLNLSEKELGLMLSPCRSAHFIRAIEMQEVAPSIDCIIQISNCSGVSLDWLLKGQGPRNFGR